MTAQFQLKQQAYASGLKSRALSILIYLIDRSNKELTCFPAIPTMAEQLHISISTVKRALHELVNCGFIKKDPRFREKNRGQTSNLYTLVMKENKEPVVTITPEPQINDMPVSTAEEKMVTEKAEQQKAHVVTRISFADIAGHSITQETKIVADTEAVQDTKQPCVRPSDAQAQKSTPIHFSIFRTQCYQVSSSIYHFKCLFARVIHNFTHLNNKWTGAEVNLQPP